MNRKIWSLRGGYTRVLGQPRHRAHGSPGAELAGAVGAHDCEWLDGAFCVYRASALVSRPFREDFFLYVEENELHRRLKNDGWRIVCSGGVLVEQQSLGVPAFLLARNTQMMLRLHGTRLQRAVTVPAIVLRRSLRKLLRGGSRHERRELARGWLSGLRQPL